MSAHGPSSAPQGCSISPDDRAALHATASCFAALHATASCFARGYRDGIASPRPTVCLEFPITIGSTSPLTCSLQELARSAAGAEGRPEALRSHAAPGRICPARPRLCTQRPDPFPTLSKLSRVEPGRGTPDPRVMDPDWQLAS